MPRGIKKEINYKEEIERINLRILHHENSIKELEEKKESLIQRKTEKDVNVLTNYLTQNNLSAEELIQNLNLNLNLAVG